MAGFGIYGLVELARGGGTGTARVITESVLILAFAAGMALLARLWLGRSGWPGTPTVVWHALLIPVVVSMAGRPVARHPLAVCRHRAVDRSSHSGSRFR